MDIRSKLAKMMKVRVENKTAYILIVLLTLNFMKMIDHDQRIIELEKTVNGEDIGYAGIKNSVIQMETIIYDDESTPRKGLATRLADLEALKKEES